MFNGVSHTVQAVQLLWGTGARHILVLNVPDLGLTPMAYFYGMSDELTQLSAAYDHALAQALQGLSTAGIFTIDFDAFRFIQALVNSPADYGLTDVTDPLYYLGGSGDPDQFLFWDSFHPTTRAHELLAQNVVDRIINEFLPANGAGMPPARVNALHGVVRAASVN